MIWPVARSAFRSLAHLSDGIRVGVEFGFSSGEMLDYVYQNRAGGLGMLGRAIDRRYLESPGWRGIRERRANLIRTLGALVLARRAQGLSTHVLDIAAGPGRYLLDLAQELGPCATLSIECRDADADAIQLGRSLAAERDLTNVRYVRHDALDASALESIRPRPDIVVVSGLYEILLDEDAIRGSIGGVHRLLPSGGILVLTGQPHHPQLELIARLLTHRDGSPWRMQLRSTEQLEGWCRDTGFVDIRTQGDSQGIFSISIMRKP